MCGRYAATRDPAALALDFDAFDGTDGQAPERDYNVAPTKPVLAVVDRHPRDAEGTADPERTARSIRVMRWGLVPHWAKDPSAGARMINARAESVADKPAFKSSLAARRCLLPADGWYEWQKQPDQPKQPFFMTHADGSGLAFAGLWATWRAKDAESGASPLVTCSVLTTESTGPFAEIHDRMPLVLPRAAWAAWLDPDSRDVGELLVPPGPEVLAALELRPVSTAVNDVRREGPELVERVAAPEPVDPDQPTLLDLDRL